MPIGVVPASELANKGRLEQGDVAFIHKPRISAITGKVVKNAAYKNAFQEKVTVADMHPHAHVHNLAGLDWINRKLQSNNFTVGRTVLANSINPADHWRSLSFLQEWVVDGVVMSNDTPGYVMSAGSDSRNDQVFNIAIQGPTQVNNGYVDDRGRGVAVQHDRASALAGGHMPRVLPPGATLNSLAYDPQTGVRDIGSLIGGPFYHQYPLQMFDRKIKPLSELYIGLVCRYITGEELKEIMDNRDDEFYPSDNDKWGNGKEEVKWIHCFQYVLFSDRQVWNIHPRDASGYLPDTRDVNHNGRSTWGRDVEDWAMASEPASRRRGPNDPERERTAGKNPRGVQTNWTDLGQAKRQRIEYENTMPYLQDTFNGVTEHEIFATCGAWRIGKVLDTASQRKEGFTGGPVDTAFRLTVNVSLEFLDWRALRRKLCCGYIGSHHTTPFIWDKDTASFGVTDLGKTMQWPTAYVMHDNQLSESQMVDGDADAGPDTNIPINSEVLRQRVVYRVWDDRTERMVEAPKYGIRFLEPVYEKPRPTKNFGEDDAAFNSRLEEWNKASGGVVTSLGDPPPPPASDAPESELWEHQLTAGVDAKLQRRDYINRVKYDIIPEKNTENYGEVHNLLEEYRVREGPSGLYWIALRASSLPDASQSLPQGVGFLALKNALAAQESDECYFSPDEWDAFGVIDLSMDRYVWDGEAKNRYWMPSREGTNVRPLDGASSHPQIMGSAGGSDVGKRRVESTGAKRGKAVAVEKQPVKEKPSPQVVSSVAAPAVAKSSKGKQKASAAALAPAPSPAPAPAPSPVPVPAPAQTPRPTKASSSVLGDAVFSSIFGSSQATGLCASGGPSESSSAAAPAAADAQEKSGDEPPIFPRRNRDR